MLRINANVNTVKVFDLVIKNLTDATGAVREHKEIGFTVATKRDYKARAKDKNGNYKIENGRYVMEYPTDYIYCVATGGLAQAINDNCKGITNDPKSNGTNHNYVSRKLGLSGHLESYRSARNMVVTANIGNQAYNVPCSPIIDNVKFVVRNIEFLDSQSRSGKPSTYNSPNVNGGVQYGQPVNGGVQYGQVPVNTGVQYGQPVNTGVPVNRGVQYNQPVNTGVQYGQPVNGGVQYGQPVNTGVPVNGGVQYGQPVNGGVQYNQPVNTPAPAQPNVGVPVNTPPAQTQPNGEVPVGNMQSQVTPELDTTIPEEQIPNFPDSNIDELTENAPF